ncbi:hypothetical protein D4R51_03025 [bacterium]|nr:MAG: hypothetical protein D4R51_03025 [bacterium]
MNWKYATLIFIACYIGIVLPVLDTIGSIIMSPFKPKVYSINNSMKNKTLAIFGIGTYILGVITSATDLEGNFRFPIVLGAISEIATIIFIVMAVIRLWKGSKYVSIMLASSTIVLFALTIIQEITLPQYGSLIIILLNVTKVINFLVAIYAIFLLWAMEKYEETFKN